PSTSAGAAAGGSPGTEAVATTTVPGGTSPGKVTSVTATLEPWHLGAPLSREVVLPDGPDLLVLGGLDASGSSTGAVLLLDPATGKAIPAGSLSLPTHDAGGAVLHGRSFVIGGGAATIYDTVQGMKLPSVPTASTAASSGYGSTVSILSHSLPRPRADVSVAQGGGTAYVAGGYDGPSLDAAVLSTTDGHHFKVVAQLPHPVRYAGLAVAGHDLYVLGGEAGGAPTDLIQKVDTTTGAVTVAGHLPSPVSGAEAVVLGGQVFVLGGKVGGKPSSQVVRFDPGTGQAAIDGHLPVAVTNAGAAVVGGVGYLIGGEGPQPLATVVRIQAG
ncbi:MAG: hypothetical protein ACRD0J_03240, partial [Acidimicrobiales bacterium]